ncbi:MAG: type II toxin-antitoxin system VapC family toxin [Burkholderiales bacterium]|nr:type II toxin-antitoxin system VapC family toxin [Phycisphaerae bacterium]
MIVADTNILVALTIPSAHTSIAERVWDKDPLWFAPPLARSEFTNVVVKALMAGSIDWQSISELCAHFEQAVRITIAPPPTLVVQQSLAHRCSTYDTEFALTAEALNCRVVTFDRQFRERFGKVAVSPDEFLSGGV